MNHLDHVGIFLMIAGSYVPAAMLALPQTGPLLGGTVWTAAVVGSLYTMGVFGERGPPVLLLIIYILTGGSIPPSLPRSLAPSLSSHSLHHIRSSCNFLLSRNGHGLQ